MKKIISILLISIIFIGMAYAYTEDEVKNMNDDELFNQYGILYEEMKRRNINMEIDIEYDEADLIDNGRYICGESISPGKYAITMLDATKYYDLDSAKFGIVYIDESVTSKIPVIFETLKDGETLTFDISEGQVLVIENVNKAILKPYAEKNWMKK